MTNYSRSPHVEELIAPIGGAAADGRNYSMVTGDSDRPLPVGRPTGNRTSAILNRLAPSGSYSLPPMSAAPPSKPFSVQRRERLFKEAVEALLINLGAELPPRQYWWAPWTIDTRAGKLYILIYGNRVTCTFDDVSRAAAYLGVSPGCRLQPNGSWNFVYDEGPDPEHVDAFRAEFEILFRRTTANGIAAVVEPVPSSGRIRRPTVVGVAAPADLTARKPSGPLVVPPARS